MSRSQGLGVAIRAAADLWAGENAGTVFLVTHSGQVVEESCTGSIWLHDGEVILDGPAYETAQRYRWSAWNVAKDEQEKCRTLLEGARGEYQDPAVEIVSADCTFNQAADWSHVALPAEPVSLHSDAAGKEAQPYAVQVVLAKQIRGLRCRHEGDPLARPSPCSGHPHHTSPLSIQHEQARPPQRGTSMNHLRLGWEVAQLESAIRGAEAHPSGLM